MQQVRRLVRRVFERTAWGSLVVCAFLAAAACCVACRAYAQEKPLPAKANRCVVIKDEAELRAGPGGTHPALLSVYKGDELEVVDVSGEWVKVEFAGNDFSWIFSGYVERLAGRPELGAITGTAVNVRAGAGMDYDAIGRLEYGRNVRILDERDGWYKIKPMPDAVAWIRAESVKLETAEPGAGDEETKVERPDEAAVQGDAAETTQDLESLYKEAVAETRTEMEKKVGQWDFTALLKKFTRVFEQADNTILRLRARGRIRDINVRMAEQERYLVMLKVERDLKEALKRIEETYQTREFETEDLLPPLEPVQFTAAGTVDRIYTYMGDFTHKLVDSESGDALYLLKSDDDIDLKDYEGKRVKLTGTPTVVEGFPTEEFEIEEIGLMEPEPVEENEPSSE